MEKPFWDQGDPGMIRRLTALPCPNMSPYQAL